MRKTTNVARLGLISLLGFMLAACGGSSDGGDNDSTAKLSVSPVPDFELVAGDTISHQISLTGAEFTDVSITLTDAPTGLTLSPTGLMSYKSEVTQPADTTVSMQVVDNRENGANTVSMNFDITELNLFDLTSTAETNGFEGQEYRYSPVIDANVDDSALEFELSQAPAGMTVSNQGTVTWTPPRGVLASGEVTLSVSASNNGFSDQRLEKFTIDVEPIIYPLEIDSISSQTIESGDDFVYQIELTNPNTDIGFTEVTYSIEEAPTGLSVTEIGEITFSSSATQTTTDNVKVSATLKQVENAQPTSVAFELTQAVYVATSGEVIDFFTNSPIEDANITLSIDGTLITEVQSDSSGNFLARVLDIELGERLVLTADRTGYSENSSAITVDELGVLQQLRLAPVHNTVAFDNQEGETLQIENQTIVVLPQNSLVDAQGNIVNNAIAELTIIDPMLNIDLMPGEMVTPTEDGELVPIESFGAITVTFEDTDGNPLNIAEGSEAEIRIPVSGTNPPATIPLYYYDTVAGVWIEEGEAELVYAVEGNYYLGNVTHFTTWNADIIFDTIQLSGCVVDEEGELIRGARIVAEGQDYNGRSSAYSNIDGEFTLPVRRNSTILVSAQSNYQSRTQRVSTFSWDQELSDCLQLEDAFTSIQLTWGANPRDLDSHFTGPNESDGDRRFEIYYGNKTVDVEGVRMFLDVDDTSGYGPEVISVPEFPLPGTYSYFVNRYAGSGQINPDETRVELVINGQRRTYTPPAEGIAKYWYVFDLVVDESGNIEIVEIQEFFSSKPTTPYLAVPTTAPRSLNADAISIPKQLQEQKYYSEE
ncbi:hypothetical protein ACPV5S_15410 [Vibrio astriarenae]